MTGKATRAHRDAQVKGCIGRAIQQAVRPVVDGLESRRLFAGMPVITEFAASNSSGFLDGNGVESDWIEIQNQGDQAIDLQGWSLTDDPTRPTRWVFPSKVVQPGGFLVVFASGNNTPDPAGNLHTNFSLNTEGENLSLRRPDGTIASQIGSNGSLYPPQYGGISYGVASVLSNTVLVNPGASVKATVPINGSFDGGQWTAPGFSDASWLSGTTGVGFDGGGTASTAALLGRWSAQSLNNLADNALVSSWAVATGSGTATQGNANNQPRLIKNQINGRSVVRFDGVNDQLRVTNQSLNGATNFTIAMLIRTSNTGVGESTQWYNNSGIVDAEVAGVTNDWGVAINSTGRIGVGVGNPDVTAYSGTSIADGQPHIIVFTKSGTATSLSIDGGVPIPGTVSANARTVGQLVFGSLQTNINYFKGDIGEVRLYNDALDADAVRALSSQIASLWGTSLAPGVYTSQLGLNLQSQMADTATTALLRVPFTVSNPSIYDRLTLDMKYDDGFVAYLNGVEVARRNAPGGEITYQSTAASIRSDSAALVAESIDISAYVNLLVGGGGTNVLAIRALNSSLADSDLLVVPKLTASVSTVKQAYMPTPTPGAANNQGFNGLTSSVTFSAERGYYTSAFVTQLFTQTVGATIVYTLDGSEPTLENGTRITPPGGGGLTTTSLNITGSTVVRAVAFLDTYLPSTVVAQSYLFVSNVLNQTNVAPAGAYWDTEVDPEVVNLVQTYSVGQALTSIPTISLSMSTEEMFGPTGIYTNPLNRGREYEREVSVEYFNPSNATDEFLINAGIRIQGGVSRDPSRPKKSFKLYFRSEYGEGKLEYPLFGLDNLAEELDHLVLRAGHNYSWGNAGGTPVTRADYLRDEFARQTQEAITGHASRGSFVQLYINGLYWGLYNVAEELDQDWAAQHFGGEPEDYDVIQPDNEGGVEADEGNLDAWNQLFTTADTAIGNDGLVDASEYQSLAAQVDMKALVGYMLNIFYRGDNDAPILIGSTTSPRNFVAVHNRNDPNGKIIFQTWDGELAMDNLTYDRTEVYGNQNPGRLYQQLRTNAEFRQLVVDEIYRLFYNGGPLSTAAATARFNGLVSEIDVAIVGESARWGDSKRSNPALRDTDWLGEINWIRNTYLSNRTAVVLAQLRVDFPELNTLAPVANINGSPSRGGTIPSGSSLTLTNPNSPATGTIYYTLDGTDPRASGGGLSGGAIAYSSGFILGQSKRLMARVLRDGVWSPLEDLTFLVEAPKLRLAEMMFNPPSPGTGSPYGRDEFEFLELVNIGSTPIDLSGMAFNAGITTTLPTGTILAAGARGVVVRNVAAFQYAYGSSVQILGSYPDKLADGGEQIRLYDPVSGRNIFDFTFVDSWYPTTDGAGYSLVVKDLSADQSNPSVLGAASAWRASLTVGGAPGLAEANVAVSGRHVFYNNSKFDGASAALNASDDAAIAPDKVPLFPGQTASFANYTSYSRGLNGLMIDVAGLNQAQIWALTIADFSLRVSDASLIPVWSSAPTGATLSIRRGAGANGSDRISIAWPDNLISGRWLEINLLANGKTGLASADVFYFGNAPGESGNSAGNAIVDINDELGARNNPRTFASPAPINFAWDYNRDGKVNATDEIIARNGATTASTSLKLITVPAAAPALSLALPLRLRGYPDGGSTSRSGTATLLQAPGRFSSIHETGMFSNSRIPNLLDPKEELLDETPLPQLA